MVDRPTRTEPAPFDGDLLRSSAVHVLDHLPPHLVDRMTTKYGSADAVVDAMVALGERVWGTLDRRGRRLSADAYPLFAVALLSVNGKVAGVQQNATNVVNAFDQLMSFGDVPIEVAAQSRTLRDKDLVAPLLDAARVVCAVRALRPDDNPAFIAMVTTAVVSTSDTLSDPVAAVISVLDRGALLAGRHRARLAVEPGPDPKFPVIGNVDLVGQVAAYRVAVAELSGMSPDDADQAVAGHAIEVAQRLRRALREPVAPSRGRTEVDAVTALVEFARFLAADGPERGSVAGKVFRRLHPEFDAMAMRQPRNEFPVDSADSTFTRDQTQAVEPGTAIADADQLAWWMLVELFAGTTPAQRAALTAWLTGQRKIGDQDGLPFLVDRVRRVEARLREVRGEPPRIHEHAGTAEAFATVRSRVRDALVLGLRGGALALTVLPPLWVDRQAAVQLVASKLRVELGRKRTTRSRAALVAAVVVRAPAQQVLRASEKSRPDACPCGVVDRAPLPPTDVCPHRPWSESGLVENYTTLTWFAECDTESATRMDLSRYRGPWQEWVHEVRERPQ
ncbi:hypothetical protein N8J89_31180 [Crossiella sp. CA-258035]|uniref:hypothetical protein n=1 Tax=Crossiella sp. CA-258035 TaxID=2981138 RepID=UPI0024BC805B|nr:hypothetical protein [Crossiella sp. CA-258035]WHT17559.1 hypothetical protein N8J89_31180 [Crossiella sp. CA-258035]